MRLCSIGETHGATVPETAIKFIHSVRLGIEPVTRITARGQKSNLTAIMRMTNTRQSPTVFEAAVVQGSLLFLETVLECHAIFGLSAQEMIFSLQPLKGGDRLVGMTTAPPVRRFTGNGVTFQTMASHITITSTGNGHLFKGAKARPFFKIALEGPAPFFEQVDVRLAIRQQFMLEIEHATPAVLTQHATSKKHHGV